MHSYLGSQVTMHKTTKQWLPAWVRKFPVLGGEMSHVCCVAHIINLIEQVCLLLTCIPGLSNILLQAFLVPFKAPRHQNATAKGASTAGDVVSHSGPGLPL